MAVPELARVRRAALLLHALSPTMRTQVIARLDAAESALLKPLLDELTNLGVSPAIGQHLLASEPPAGMSPPTPLTLEEQMERLRPEEVVRCLEPCAPATVAQLMRAGNWSWKARALELMPEARRASVYECMRSAPPVLAPAVLRVLFERLCACGCAQLDPPQTADSAAHQDAWTIWLAKVRAHLVRSFGWMR